MLVSASRATRSLCHAREEILAFLEQLVCGLDSDNALSQRLQAAETFLEHLVRQSSLATAIRSDTGRVIEIALRVWARVA